MLAKQIIGYIPSAIIPALASFAAIYCYTRLLNPGEYGYYTLALNIMTLLSAVFFYWLHLSIPRLMPEAVKGNSAPRMRATAYMAFAASAGALIIAALPLAGLADLGDFAPLLWLAAPLAIARSLLTLNQAFHRSALDYKSYNIVECGQAVLGLGGGLALVYFLGMGHAGAILGMVGAMALMALVDFRAFKSVAPKNFSRTALADIARFGLPLVISYALAVVISISDRFFIGYFSGAGDVGIYAAGYSTMERLSSLMFMIVAAPSLSLTIHRLEQEGAEAARAQTGRNGAATLALAVPACAGLLMVDHQIAAVLIGGEFRAGAAQVMPWIAVAAMLGGFATHYFDHAFFLGKKPHLLILTQGLAALLNVTLNILWIPQYGYMGAAYASLASYAALLMLSIIVGQRVFTMSFPFRDALKILAAAALMALALAAAKFPATMLGLIGSAALGAAVYAAMAFAFDVMGIRSRSK